MRAFLALELPPHARQTVAVVQSRLRQTGAGAAWVRQENFHVTLRFLGRIEEEQQQICSQCLLQRLPHLEPVRICIAGAGAFPNAGRPSVLWAGVRELHGALEDVFVSCEDAARAAGLPPEARAFHPHVTVARVRNPRGCVSVAEAIQECSTLESDAFTVDGVALFESKLSAGGSVYRLVKRFPLPQ